MVQNMDQVKISDPHQPRVAYLYVGNFGVAYLYLGSLGVAHLYQVKYC